MLIRIGIAGGILLGLAGLGVAQQKPDFSGEWTLNRQASTLSPGAAAVQMVSCESSTAIQPSGTRPRLSVQAAPCSTNTNCSRMAATSAPLRTE